MTTTENPYLQGNFAPVHEEVTATELPVTGQVPESLCGRYLRNGPNPLLAPEPGTYHWFTGDGMVHGIRLRDGRAEWYRNRWVRSDEVARALGEEPRPGAGVHADMDFAANTNVIGHAGRTFAIVEGGSRPYELTDELDTIGSCDFGGTLEGGYTAHPKRDPKRRALRRLLLLRVGRRRRGDGHRRGARVRSFAAGHDGRSRQPARLRHHAALRRAPRPPGDLQHGRPRRGRSFPYRWQEGYHSRIGLLPKDGDSTDVVWHDVEECYVFHPMNAFDEPGGGDGIVLDVVRHPSMFRTQVLGPAEGTPTLERWHLDGRGGAVKEERLDDRGQEFPRVDERRVGCPTATGIRSGSRRWTTSWAPSPC